MFIVLPLQDTQMPDTLDYLSRSFQWYMIHKQDLMKEYGIISSPLEETVEIRPCPEIETVESMAREWEGHFWNFEQNESFKYQGTFIAVVSEYILGEENKWITSVVSLGLRESHSSARSYADELGLKRALIFDLNKERHCESFVGNTFVRHDSTGLYHYHKCGIQIHYHKSTETNMLLMTCNNLLIDTGCGPILLFSRDLKPIQDANVSYCSVAVANNGTVLTLACKLKVEALIQGSHIHECDVHWAIDVTLLYNLAVRNIDKDLNNFSNYFLPGTKIDLDEWIKNSNSAKGRLVQDKLIQLGVIEDMTKLNLPGLIGVNLLQHYNLKQEPYGKLQILP